MRFKITLNRNNGGIYQIDPENPSQTVFTVGRVPPIVKSTDGHPISALAVGDNVQIGMGLSPMSLLWMPAEILGLEALPDDASNQ